MISKYHVYILGAGASFHAGLPVLSDFFHKAEKLCSGNMAGQAACNGYDSAIKLLRQYRFQNRNKCQRQDIEDVYRLALETNDIKVLEALEQVILGLLDLHGCLVNYNGKQYQPNIIYDAFVQKIYPVSERMIRRRNNVDDSVIITFNWDCLIDYAMFYNCFEPFYCLAPYNRPNAPKLLKMHGSINWGTCRECSSAIKIIPPNDFVGTRYIREPLEFDLRIVTEGLGRRKCDCGRPLAPKIVPPTHKKRLSGEMIQIWNAAEESLEKAYKITLIGYSFPMTDTDILNLLQEALDKNIDLMEIEVVNPGCIDNEFKDNYKNIFGNNADKIVFNNQKFEEYVYQMR